MISLRPRRHWVLPLLLYVAIDFMDPAIPGVFFFDTQAFFVDGVVQTKSDAPSHLATAEPTPMPLGGSADYHDENSAAGLRVTTRPVFIRQVHRNRLKHDESASLSSSSPDSSSTAALS